MNGTSGSRARGFGLLGPKPLRAPTLFYGIVCPVTPIVLAALGELSGAAAAASWFVGLVGWTLFEYAFHRWAQHSRRLRPLLRHWDDHGLHHAEPYNPQHFVYALHESLPPAAILTGLFILVAPSVAAGVSAAAGLSCGYLVNEWVHFASHSPELCEGRPWLARWAAHHARHHWERGDAFYGFITRFWDRLFGTCPPNRPCDIRAEDDGEER
jgi:sterol desaturase/sphingolipid hydroxylase (fatty acid hydroxylase superfamily)